MSSEVKRPDKLYYRIGEVSSMTGVPSYVLRFWESEFSHIRPQRTESGQRLYRPMDVERINEIKDLLHRQKFTIQGARRYLRHRDTPQTIDWRQELASVRQALLEIRKLLR